MCLRSMIGGLVCVDNAANGSTGGSMIKRLVCFEDGRANTLHDKPCAGKRKMLQAYLFPGYIN